MLVWLDVGAMTSKLLISSGNRATVSIADLNKEKISFQNKFSDWADVFQSPKFIKTRTLAATPVEIKVLLRKSYVQTSC